MCQCNKVQLRSTEKMFEDLDETTKQQVLPLRTVNRKASEFQGFHMNWEGTRRLDNFEERYVGGICGLLLSVVYILVPVS